MNTLLRKLPLNLSALKDFILGNYGNLTPKKKRKLKMRPEVIHLNPAHKDKKPGTLLWLDDRINPMERRMDWLTYSPIGRKINVIWVKDFFDFKKWICDNGLPDAICFDYDLGENTPTGYDCAKWLVNHCKTKQLALPLWSSQSANTDGKAKINRLLRKNFTHSESI